MQWSWEWMLRDIWAMNCLFSEKVRVWSLIVGGVWYVMVTATLITYRVNYDNCWRFERSLDNLWTCFASASYWVGWWNAITGAIYLNISEIAQRNGAFSNELFEANIVWIWESNWDSRLERWNIPQKWDVVVDGISLVDPERFHSTLRESDEDLILTLGLP
jgi:hypothetical protein